MYWCLDVAGQAHRPLSMCLILNNSCREIALKARTSFNVNRAEVNYLTTQNIRVNCHVLTLETGRACRHTTVTPV